MINRVKKIISKLRFGRISPTLNAGRFKWKSQKLSNKITVLASFVVVVAAGVFGINYMNTANAAWQFDKIWTTQSDFETGTIRTGSVDTSSVPGDIVVGGVGDYPVLVDGTYRGTLVLMNSGKLYARGISTDGQLGLGSAINKPSDWSLVMSDVSSFTTGYNDSYAIKTDGSLWATGKNQYGELGLGHTDPVLSWTDTGLTGVSKVAVGGYHALVLKSDHTLYGTGYGNNNQLSNGGVSKTSWTLLDISTLGAEYIVDISAGRESSYLVAATNVDGTGTRSLWETGARSASPAYNIWTKTISSNVLKSVSQTSSEGAWYDDNAFVLKTDGALLVSGSGWGGVLGTGDSDDKAPWVQTASDVADIVVGGEHAIIKKTNNGGLYGTGWAGGGSGDGRLGNLSGVISWAKITVSGLADSAIGSVSVGPEQSYIIDNSNKIYMGGICYPNITVLTALTPATIATGSNPYGITISPDGASAYVVNNSSGTISMYSRDTSTGALTALTPATIATGDNPDDITISPDGKSVYVANSGSNSISTYSRDTSTGALTALTPATIDTVGPLAIAISPDGTSVYITNVLFDSYFVSMYSRDTSTGALTALAVAEIATGGNPGDITISPDGKSVYVANSGSNSISTYSRDTSTGALTALSPATIATGSNPYGITISPDGKSVYVANSGSSSISMYSRDTSTGALTALSPATIATGSNSRSITISADGASVYVVNNGSGTVSMYSRGLGFVSAGRFSNSTDSIFASTLTGSVSGLTIDAGVGNLYNWGDASISYQIDNVASYASLQYRTGSSPANLASASWSSIRSCSANSASTCFSVNAISRLIEFKVNLTTLVIGSTVSNTDVQYISLSYVTDTTPPTNPTSAKAYIITNNYPDGITISADGASAYVTNYSSSTISMYSRDTSTGALIALTPATIATGNAPYGITISPNGASVYVTNIDSNTASMYSRDTSTGALTALTPATIATGSNPYGITISPDGASAYVVNNSSGTISMYSRDTSTSALTLLSLTDTNESEIVGSMLNDSAITGNPSLYTVYSNIGNPSFKLYGATDEVDGSGLNSNSGNYAVINRNPSMDPYYALNFDWCANANAFPHYSSVSFVDFGDIWQECNGGSRQDASGTYYLNARMSDNAGNMAALDSLPLLRYVYDPIAPTAPASLAVSPAVWSVLDTYTFNWVDSTDPRLHDNTNGSGVAGYQYKVDGDINNWSSFTTTAATTFTLSGNQVQDGEHIVYVRSIDNAGNTSSPVSIKYRYSGSAPSAPLLPSVGPQSSNVNSFNFNWKAPAGYVGTIKGFRYSINSSPDLNNTKLIYVNDAIATSENIINSTNLPAGFYYNDSTKVYTLHKLNAATQQDDNILYIAAVGTPDGLTDQIAFGDGNVSQLVFSINTDAPEPPKQLRLEDASVNVDKPKPTYVVALSWAAPSDKTHITGYYIQRALPDPVPVDKVTKCTGLSPGAFQTIGSTSNNVTSFIDAGSDDPLVGTCYFYQVISKDDSGKYSWNPSDTLNSYDPSAVGINARASIVPSGSYTTAPGIKDEETKQPSQPVAIASVSTATVTWYTQGADIIDPLNPIAGNLVPDYDHTADSFVEFGTEPIGDIPCGTIYGKRVGNLKMTNSHSVLLSGLQPDTLYHYRSFSADKDTNNVCSVDQTFHTQPAPRVENMSIQDVRLYTALLTWNTSEPVNSDLLYGQNTSYAKTISDVSGGKATVHSVLLTGLQDSSTYHFAIRMYDNDTKDAITGEYDYLITSDDYTFETQKYPKISNVKYQPLNDQATAAFKVTWDTNVPTTSVAQFKPDGGIVQETVKTKLETEHSITLNSLFDNTYYLMNTLGVDQFGNTAISESQRIKTAYDTRPPATSNVATEVSNTEFGTAAKSQIVVSWQTDEPGTSQVEYDFGVTGDSYGSKTQEDANLTTSHVVVLTDLRPSSAYHLRAVSNDASGNKGVSEQQSVLTEQARSSILDIIINSLQSSLGWLFGMGK